jgi:hypothetical protein
MVMNTKFDEDKYQAESIVTDKIKKTPEYKKAVSQTVKEIKQLKANIKVTMPNPKGKKK